MGEFIANEDMTVKFQNTAPGAPPLTYLGDLPIDAVKIVPVKATKLKLNSKFACIQNITITWAPAATCAFSYTGFTQLSGSGSVASTSAKCKTGGQFVLREQDTGTCAGTWQRTTSPFDSIACACNVNIQTAGQDKAKAE